MATSHAQTLLMERLRTVVPEVLEEMAALSVPASPGPWDDELDWFVWEHAGLACVILRHRFGTLNAYVVVPKEHSAYDLDVDQFSDIDVHGGVTYAGHLHSLDWWIGFDAMHMWDLIPAMHRPTEDSPFSEVDLAGPERDFVYRDFDYVMSECNKLADVIASRTKWGYYDPDPTDRIRS